MTDKELAHFVQHRESGGEGEMSLEAFAFTFTLPPNARLDQVLPPPSKIPSSRHCTDKTLLRSYALTHAQPDRLWRHARRGRSSGQRKPMQCKWCHDTARSGLD
jgi:hypothetical protein